MSLLFCSILINISIFICILLIQIQTLDEIKQKHGWKLVRRDVFRPPQYRPMLLSAFIATGLQLLFVLLVAIVFGFSQIASHFAHHDTMLTAVIVLYLLTGFIAGYCRYVRGGVFILLCCYLIIIINGTTDLHPNCTYHSSCLCKLFHCKNWKMNALVTTFMFSGFVYSFHLVSRKASCLLSFHVAG